MSTDTNTSLYANLEDKELFPVGFPVLINRHADPNSKVNQHIATSMKVVDLLPVGFILNYKAMTNNENAGIADWLQYEFDFYIKEYQRKLENLQIKKFDKTYGVRMWITGESQGMDSIQNSFTNNAISEMIKNQVQNSALGQLHSMARSFGYGNVFSSYNNGSTKGGRMMMNLLFEGRHVSLPKIWEESSYSNNYSFTVKLSSPYGSLEAIKRFIAEPLMRLIALVSSSSNDGITYGLPPYLYVRGYGLTYMKLGIPTNIQIVRGSEDRINKHKQPLDIVVTLTIESAIPGFAALLGTTNSFTDNQSGVAEDIGIDDMLKIPDEWGDFGGDGNVKIKNFMDLLKNTKTGPALNTMGGILKSLLPTPATMSNEYSYDNPSIKELLAAKVKEALNNGDYTIQPSNNPQVAAAAPSMANTNLQKQLQDVNLNDLMNPSIQGLRIG